MRTGCLQYASIELYSSHTTSLIAHTPRTAYNAYVAHTAASRSEAGPIVLVRIRFWGCLTINRAADQIWVGLSSSAAGWALRTPQ